MDPETAEAADQLLSSEALINDPHYLQAVTDMAGSREVTASDAIYSSTGFKLLDKGAKVDQRLYDRLQLHQLLQPIENSLQVQNAVDLPSLEAQVVLLTGSTQLGRKISALLGDEHYILLEVLRHIPWPPQVGFKMTVMREQLPQLFEHSVLMMMCTVYLAIKQRMTIADCAELAAAALLHDVGMLYMPPSWKNVDHKLTLQERKQLAAHSITGMLVVRETGAYSARMADAVLEHHERLDGSGYPRRTKGDEVSPWGRILMLAEVMAAFYSKFSDMPAQRLSLMLRMNHRRFDPVLTEHAYALLRAADEPADSPSHTSAEVRQVIATLAAVMQHWIMCKRKFPEPWHGLPGSAAAAYVDTRLQSLEKALAESGAHPRQQADWLKIFEEDPSSMAELVLINKEALWQVESCVEACIRQWPQLRQPSHPLEEVLEDWLQSCRSVLGLAASVQEVAADAVQ